MRVTFHPHSHSGKLVPHRHTHYGGLFMLIALAAVIVGAFSYSADATTVSGPNASNPISDSTGVYATVVAKKPSQTPVITSPASGIEVTSVPQTVSGSCQSGYTVKVMANGVIAGAVSCPGGHFSVPIDLFWGRNSLTAQSFNALDQGGGVSDAIGLTFIPPGNPNVNLFQFQQFTASTAPTNDLFINTDVLYRGGAAGSEQSWQLALVGGTAPYAVSITWGDGKSDVYSRTASGPFTIHHTYPKDSATKSYPVVVKASDSAGNTAYIQLVSVPMTTAKPTATIPGPNKLAVVWPILGALALIVAGFFFGEWQGRHSNANPNPA